MCLCRISMTPTVFYFPIQHSIRKTNNIISTLQEICATIRLFTPNILFITLCDHISQINLSIQEITIIYDPTLFLHYIHD